MQLLTPVRDVAWLSSTDTVRDAFDHMEAYNVTAAPLLDWSRHYLGTVTEADLRRHVAGTPDRMRALGAPLASIDRRAHTEPVTADREIGATIGSRARSRSCPSSTTSGRLLGVVDRGRILDAEAPTAA